VRADVTFIRSDELLTTAAFRGEVERVRAMLDHRAVPDARDEKMCTALHWACSMGHIDVAALLVKRGADPNVRAVNGETPLHVAAREGDAEMAEFLLGVGANPRLCSSAGRTALELALDHADDEVELIGLLRRAQKEHDALLLEQKKAEANKPRPKVQIVWEADLLKEAAAAANAAPGAAVDTGCGPDEPLDVSDGATLSGGGATLSGGGATLSGGGATLSCGGATLDATDDAELAVRLDGACNLVAVAADSAGAPAPKKDALDAAALSSLAANLFSWNAAAANDGLPM
jgi:hypothetical protein